MMYPKTICAGLTGVLLATVFLFAAEPSMDAQRTLADKEFQAGNFRDAYEVYRKLALDPQTLGKLAGSDLQQAIACLQRLARVNEIDAFREEVIRTHADKWRLLQTAAQSYMQGPHHGFIVAGDFERGDHRGGGQYADASERDRVRALQLMTQAMPLVEKESNKPTAAGFYLEFAQYWLGGRGSGDAWRLQALTDLSTLPDYEEGSRYYGRVPLFGSRGSAPQGAPVNADGNPVLHQVPASYAESKSDGERWRWMLDKAAEVDPDRHNEVQMIWANFLHGQFGVQTMRTYGLFGGRQSTGDGKQSDDSPYAVHTLKDNETIARLATGAKRFTLPGDFQFIRLYQQVAESGKNSHAEQALETLANLFENRRQYPRAAEYWRKAIEQFGPGSNQHRQQRLDQIVDNWGEFQNVTVQPAGQGADVDFRFRNGKSVTFTAQKILTEKLLTDVKAYLKSRPAMLDGRKLDIANIGYRLVERNEQQYLGEQVAQWQQELDPLADHFDRQITVTTPLQQAGAYLLTGKMDDGSISRIILWVDDTVIVKKPLDNRNLYFLADAVTGQPIEHANVEFFGYRQDRIENKNRFRVTTSEFAEFTDADGQVIPEPKDQASDYQWIVIARTPQGRFAYLGFDRVWYRPLHMRSLEETKVYAITDRPVYRPDQTVKFKFWVREVSYVADDKTRYAGQTFTVQINDPQGENVFKQEMTADEFGGFDGELKLDAEAKLGAYNISLDSFADPLDKRRNNRRHSGGVGFRVEEYKKPEFEVTVEAPDEPVMLGEKIEATIRAKYYFGAPVVNATVKYKVSRSSHTSHWFPPAPWDWLYGSGYWWFAGDYSWFPNWQRWGCMPPRPIWWPTRHDPPEVVLENEVAIGPDGTVTIEIDTALAKELHGDQDHRYEISAEVVDQSRRTIVGSGEVLVARQPFQVFAWLDRGHFNVGDTIHASFAAHTLDQKPVQGTGKLTLYRVTYDAVGKPSEAVAQEWNLNTDERGNASQEMIASQTGQYRLSYVLTDAAGHTIEGGYLFVVRGADFDGREFRFNDLELVTDKQEYQPGDTVRLLINTNRVGSTVLLFVRPGKPGDGIFDLPGNTLVLRLDGKSTVHEIAVVQNDMPNFFIEALTISDGQLHSVVRDVAVPPEKRVVNVDVQPSAKEYRPGAPANVKLKLTDANGKPIVGSVVVTMYDRAVEYISGGSNVVEIKEFFWKWRRNHQPSSESTLARYFQNIVKSGEIGMNQIGVFGDVLPQDVMEGVEFSTRGRYQERMMSARSTMEADAMPMAAPMAMMKGGGGFGGGEGAGEAEVVQPTVRKEFADTALWIGSLTTDADGFATVSLDMPENLTDWKIRVWAIGDGARVGEGSASVVTSKNLLVRLQAPRFFVETDEVVLSANVHNDLETDKQVQVALELEGGTLSPLDELKRTIMIAAHGEQRVDWRVKVTGEGEAVVRMLALTDEESDAVEMKFPVYVHGMLKTESFTGVLRPGDERAQVPLDVPAQRRINDTRLEVRYSPTLAGAMVDALPYLVNYPYGCTEQTLNRFLPTVITQNILLRMNLDLKAIQEKRTNLNAQELGDPGERAGQWKHYDLNPVFDEAEVVRMTKAGVKALTEMQVSDGGWGWFSGYGERSWPHTTAVVVHGLQIAQQNDVALVPGVLERGVAWLTNYQSDQVQLLKNAADKQKDEKKKRYKTQADNLDVLVFMVLTDAGVTNADMLAFLDRDRTKLGVYALGMFGLALDKLGETQKRDMVIRNIDQYLVQDNENQTAYLKLPGSYWWYWYGSEIEANAYYLKLLTRTEPKGEKASRLVKYLLNNRKHATYWNSTRDTAICIEALAEYLVASGESQPDQTIEVYVDGNKVKEVRVTAENLFSFDNAFTLVGDAVATGRHTLELRRQGEGPLYYNAWLTNFTLEEHITRAGLEIKVNRKFYKLVPQDKQVDVAGSRGQVVGQKVEKYERVELPNLATVTSGDLVEIELEIASKNDYEYIMFEDMKAAGFEPVELRSGYNSNSLGAYMELRDERVTFFVRALARGTHSVSYRMRAEIPGKFSALPTRASAMYAPELKGNSDEIKLLIQDR